MVKTEFDHVSSHQTMRKLAFTMSVALAWALEVTASIQPANLTNQFLSGCLSIDDACDHATQVVQEVPAGNAASDTFLAMDTCRSNA